jgi:hypothetical protein
VSELHFHQSVLSLAGVAGIVWFFATFNSQILWRQGRRVLVGILSGLVYLELALSAFPNLSNASSAEIFGFIGCVLGCLGAARFMSVETLGFSSHSGTAER